MSDTDQNTGNYFLDAANRIKDDPVQAPNTTTKNDPKNTGNYFLDAANAIPDEEQYNDSLGDRLKREAGHVGLSTLEGFTDLGNLLGRGVYGLGDALDYGAHAVGSTLGLSKGESWKDTPDYKKTYLHALLDKPKEWDKQLDEYTKADGTKGERQDWANRDSYVTDIADILPYFVPGADIGKLKEIGTQGGLLDKGLTKFSNLFYGQKKTLKDKLEQNLQELEKMQPTLQKFKSEGPKTLDDVAQQKALADKQTNLIKDSSDLHTALQQNPSRLEKVGNSLSGLTAFGLPRIALIGGVQGASAASDDDIPDMLKNTALGTMTGGAIHAGKGILTYAGGKLLGLLGGKNIVYPEKLSADEIDRKAEIIKHSQKRETGSDIAAILKKDIKVPSIEESQEENATPNLPVLNLDKGSLVRSWITPQSPNSLTGATRNLIKFIHNSTGALNRKEIENSIEDYKNSTITPGLLSEPNHTYQTGAEVYKPVIDAMRKAEDNKNPFLEPYLTTLLTYSNAYKTLKEASDTLNQYGGIPNRLEQEIKNSSPEVASRIQHALFENEGNIEKAQASLNASKNLLNTEGKDYSSKSWEEGTPTNDRLQEFERETALQNKLGVAGYNPYELTNDGFSKIDNEHKLLGETVKKGAGEVAKKAYDTTKAINEHLKSFKNEFLNNHYGTDNIDYMAPLAELHRKEEAAELGEKFIHKITGGLSPAEHEINPDKYIKTLWNMSKNMRNFLENVKAEKHNEFLDNIKNNADQLQDYADNLQKHYINNTTGTQNNTRSHEELEGHVYAANAENIENMYKKLKDFDAITDQKLYNARAYTNGLSLNNDKENPITHGLIPHIASYVHPLFGLGLGVTASHREAESPFVTDSKKLLQSVADKAYSDFPDHNYKLQVDRNLPEPKKEDLKPERIKELKEKHAEILSELNHAKDKMNERVRKHQDQIDEITYLKDFRPYNTLLSSLLNQQATQDLHNLQQN